ncbi:MAG: hypothetical protein H5U05_08535 [Candidatus Aminicenantes bacterium]|nr:hypothetical protein [Candidatus Aminicenantes bacterium]
MKLRALLLSLMILLTASLGAEPRVTFSLRGGYYVPSSSTFNKQYVPAVNASLKQLSDFLADLGLSGASRNLSEITGIISFGGELEIKTGPQFYVALGSEYLFKNVTNELKLAGTIEGVAVDVSQEGKIGLSSLPVLLTIRINLPITTVRVYLGGGIGYYFNRAVINEKWLWQENLIKVSEGSRKIVATSQNIFPHANLGADLAVSSRFFLSADIRVPFGTVKNFKIKSDSLDASTVGQPLTFINSEGLETNFQWELVGPNISVNLKYRF